MSPLQLVLTPEAEKELRKIRDTDPLAYKRERASALLQIASGKSGNWVAKYGLLRPRRKHTIYDWVKRYKEEGISGLQIKDGRGRNPSFFPPKPS